MQKMSNGKMKKRMEWRNGGVLWRIPLSPSPLKATEDGSQWRTGALGRGFLSPPSLALGFIGYDFAERF